MDNLWGDFSEIEAIRTPQKILNEQASYLNSKMDNKILASLIKSQLNVHELSYERTSDFKFDFILTSPNIKSYKYRIFRLFHNVQIYPLYIKIEESIVDEISETLLDITGEERDKFIDMSDPHSYCEYEILNEEIFINSLRLILSSETIKRVVSSLTSLADTM